MSIITTKHSLSRRGALVAAALVATGVGAPAVASAATTPAPAAVSATSARPTLKLGSAGAAVTELQHRLRAKGYVALVTGYYGTMTRDAVKAFQHKHGLVADGVCGAKTWRALLADSRDVVTPNRPTLRYGLRGEPVAELQRKLNAWGTLGTLKVDGVFGVGTLKAVKAFQAEVRIPVDGIVGARTWSMLSSGLGED